MRKAGGSDNIHNPSFRTDFQAGWTNLRRRLAYVFAFYGGNRLPAEADFLAGDGGETLLLEIKLKISLAIDFRERSVKTRRSAREKFKASAEMGMQLAFKAMGDPSPGPPVSMKRQDGSFSFDPMECMNITETQWKTQVFQIYADHQPPAAEAFLKEYEHEIAMLAKQGTLPDLTAEDFIQQLKKRNRAAKGGMDQWRTHELQDLPQGALALFLPIFQLAESKGLWPKVWKKLLVPLPSKGEGNEPMKLRPISLASVLHVVYSSLRFKHLATWQASWIPMEICGGRAHFSPMDLAFPLMLEIEKRMLKKEAVLGILVDRAKCFDMVLIEIALQTMLALGCPAGVINALRGFYDGMTRAFRMGQNVGDWWKRTNGIIQGCAMSLQIVNTIFTVLYQRVYNKAPTVTMRTFVDDSNILGQASDLAGLRAAWYESLRFDKFSGQQTNVSKTKGYGSDLKARKLVGDILAGQGEIVEHGRIVGFHLHANKKLEKSLGKGRIEAGLRVLKRARAHPWFTKELREVACAMVAMPKVLYGVEADPLPRHQARDFRTACTRTMWATESTFRNPEAFLTIVKKGHLVDIYQAEPYRVFTSWKRMMIWRPDLYDLAKEVYDLKLAGTSSQGFINTMLLNIKRLGWSWNQFDCISQPGQRPFLLWDQTSSSWQHRLRDILRECRWKTLAPKALVEDDEDEDSPAVHVRYGLGGLEAGKCCLEATRFLLHRKTKTVEQNTLVQVIESLLGGRLTPWQKGVLESVLSAAVLSRAVLAQRTKILPGDAECPHCTDENSTQIEDQAHILKCPAWEHVRQPFDELMLPFGDEETKECWLWSGIAVEIPELRALNDKHLASVPVRTPRIDKEVSADRGVQENCH